MSTGVLLACVYVCFYITCVPGAHRGRQIPPEPVIDYCEPLCGCSGQPELQSETLSDGVRGAVREENKRGQGWWLRCYFTGLIFLRGLFRTVREVLWASFL